MKVWIVFECSDFTSDKVIGVYDVELKAKVKKSEDSYNRYIKECEVE